MSTVTQNDLRLANRIRRLRKQKELTQAELAEKVHVSTTHYTVPNKLDSVLRSKRYGKYRKDTTGTSRSI